MKKETIKKLLSVYAVPVGTVILGMVLVFSPDTASTLIAKVIGWICIAVGICCAIAALSAVDRGQMVSVAVLSLGLGIFITSFPLALAKVLGRIAGLAMILAGLGKVRGSLMKKKSGLPYELSLAVAIGTVVAGVVLLLLPMTLSRVLLNICGGVLVVIGILNIYGVYREQKFLEPGNDHDIIDAEP